MRVGRLVLELAPWGVIAAVAYPLVMPGDHWMKVEAVRVADVEVGEIPQMVVIRTIRREFQASWIATVRRVEAGGGLVTACPSAKGRNDYRTSSTLPGPPKLNLAWWMDGGPCHLEPGSYVVTTKWTVDLPTPWDKTIEATSNVFTVRPKEMRPGPDQ